MGIQDQSQGLQNKSTLYYLERARMRVVRGVLRGASKQSNHDVQLLKTVTVVSSPLLY